MKNTIKFLGIIALAAAIGFSMTSCGGNGGGGSNNSLRITNISAAQVQQGSWAGVYAVFPANATVAQVRADVAALLNPDPTHTPNSIAGNYFEGQNLNGISFTNNYTVAIVPLYSAESGFANRWSGTQTDVHVWIILAAVGGEYFAYRTNAVQAFTGGQLTLHAQNDFELQVSGFLN